MSPWVARLASNVQLYLFSEWPTQILCWIIVSLIIMLPRKSHCTTGFGVFALHQAQAGFEPMTEIVSVLRHIHSAMSHHIEFMLPRDTSQSYQITLSTNRLTQQTIYMQTGLCTQYCTPNVFNFLYINYHFIFLQLLLTLFIMTVVTFLRFQQWS